MVSRELTLRRILWFWLPLAGTWLMMAAEGPILAAVIARLPDPKLNLAAYGVAFALALIAEAPIIMLMAASTALVEDRHSFRLLRSFTWGLNVVITVILVLALLPPVFRIIAIDLIGLPAEVASRTHLATWLLLPWPAAIGFRRFYQGMLIRDGRTRLVALGTVVRLLSMLTTALVMAFTSRLTGAAVGGLALSAGVTAEAIVTRLMVRDTIRRVLAAVTEKAEKAKLTLAEVVRFYYPLALTSILGLGIQPVVTFFVGRGRMPIESLAVLPVIHSLLFLFRALGLAYQEVPIALLGEGLKGYGSLKRFALYLGFLASGGIALLVFTPLADLWFQGFSGLSQELADFSLLPAQLQVLLPALTVLICFQRAILVRYRATGPVTWATLVEVVGVVAILAWAILYQDMVGAVAASLALVGGRLASVAYLVPPLRRLFREEQGAASRRVDD
jgi:hypothetical protein